MKTLTTTYFRPKQGVLPMFISDSLDICDPVLTFDEFMEGIDLAKYLDKLPVHKTGRLRYNPVNMLKTVLFGFMTKGYMSLRELEENCRINIRFMYLMDNERPTYRTFTEYIPEQLAAIAERYREVWKLDQKTFVYGKGHRKSVQQRQYEKLLEYKEKLEEYVEKMNICGENRNSYSKTDHSATFMRMKKDYMGNDQLLPAYNVQIGVADEYIAVVDVNQYRSDMDCFIPLMEKFHETYEFYPKYPVADAGYGSYNNYIFCELHGMEKYMKFTMFKKETEDKRYHEDPFRPVNFTVDEKGILRCPNGKAFIFQYRKAVKGNNYARQEEVYACEDCNGCPYAEKCKRTDKNRTIRLNQELTKMHEEVIQNLESIQGALLRMNRSIQAEGTFGIIKNDRSYKRIVRRGINSVKLEIFLVSIGHNLYKYQNKKIRLQKTA